MDVEVRFPGTDPGPVPATRLLEQLRDEPHGGPLQVGDPRMVEFLSALARGLLDPALSRRHPELGSLGFFLRPAELGATVQRLRDAAVDQHGIRVPRGLAVHFPPANVDTNFVYSWALSAVSGNANVVRLSRRSGAAAQAILVLANELTAAAHPVVAQTQKIVSYDHDEETTTALSSAADLRVLWGGDRAITTLRRLPSDPLCHDVAFPDRSSFAAVSVSGWQDASPQRRETLAEGFVNDVFWFDQAACSSPRVVFWVGEEAAAAEAQAEFLSMVTIARRQRGWPIDPAMQMRKQVLTYALAASGAAGRIDSTDEALTNVQLASLGSLPRGWLGAGAVCHLRIDALEDLAPVVRRKDQTLSQFGFTREELEHLVHVLAGRGVDRIVPIGQALSFATVWDGFDLMGEFTRLVTVRA